MIRFRMALLAVSLLAIPAIAGAQEPERQTPFLEPYSPEVWGAADPYHAAVHGILLKNASSPYVRIVCLPSFQKEWVLDIRDPHGGFAEVQLVEASAEIWSEFSQRESLETIRGEAFSGRITEATAREIRRGLLVRLHEVAYPAKAPVVNVADGVQYFFSAFELGLGVLHGQTHSPERGSKPAALAELAEALRSFALATTEQRAEQETKLRKLASSLVAQ